jgi:hypothetical protein
MTSNSQASIREINQVQKPDSTINVESEKDMQKQDSGRRNPLRTKFLNQFERLAMFLPKMKVQNEIVLLADAGVQIDSHAQAQHESEQVSD